MKAGWTKVKFGEVVRLCKARSSTPEADGIERYVGLEHLEPEDLRIRNWGLVADGTTFTSRFKPGQVLFGKRRAYQRKVAVADFEGVCSGDIYVLESADPKHLLPELLPFICQTNRFFEYAVGTSAGSLSPRTNWNHLKNFELFIPPIERQEEIALKLQLIESSIKSGKDAVHYSKIVNRSFLLNELPLIHKDKARWKIKKLGDFVCVIDPNPSHRYPDYVEDGVPLVATQDFVGDNDFCFDSCRRVSEIVFEEQNKRCNFSENDVIFARKGILGLARMYGISKKVFSHTVVILKPKNEMILPRYILWLCRSDSLIAGIYRQMNSNSGVPTLGVKTIESLEFWLPSVEEQERIIKHLDSVERATALTSKRIHQNQRLKARFLNFEIDSV